MKLSPAKLIQLVDAFHGKHILVLGDLMLDHFIWGDTNRISPEAPIPVVLVNRETFVPGGAGNTAANITSLGGRVSIFGIVGRDAAAVSLEKELKKRGVDTSGIVKDARWMTIQKARVISRGQQVVRIDREKSNYIDSLTEAKLLKLIGRAVPECNAVVLSDYAKGSMTPDLIRRVIRLARAHDKIVVGDAKPVHARYFKNVHLLTPNVSEALAMAGVSEARQASRILQKRLGANILLTQGAHGMTLFAGPRILHLDSMSQEIVDVSGAGDTVVAAGVLALTAGASLAEAAFIANGAASIVVGKLGTASVLPQELKTKLA